MWINGLDEVDNKIVNLLLDDARMSYSEIGKILGLSRTTIKAALLYSRDSAKEENL